MRLALYVGFALAACSAALPSDPEPADKSKVTAERLKKLLGKSHFSEEVHALRTDLKEKPVASYHMLLEKCFFHQWKSKGIDLEFDEAGKLTNVFLYADGIDGYKRFEGEQPAKLRFGDKPADVRKKLGDPDPKSLVDGNDSGVMAGWCYPAKGLFVKFTTSDTADPKATVAIVGICAPE